MFLQSYEFALALQTHTTRAAIEQPSPPSRLTLNWDTWHRCVATHG